MELLKEIYKLLLEIIKDLQSTRQRLILLSYLFNFWLLKIISKQNGHDSLGIAAIALLTSINAFYFASKHLQSVMENDKK